MVVRINKTDNYTVMSNYHLREQGMSLKAKGLLSQMLSLPDEWEYSIAGLAKINKESESAIKSALKELREFGYLHVTKIMPRESESGRIEYIYDIFEKPQKTRVQKQGVENQPLENQPIEIQAVENQRQLNTNLLNTKNKILKNKGQYECEFDVIWEIYPRKQGKSTALKAYIKARQSGVEYQDIKQGVERYVEYIRNNNIEQRFIKQGSTWFNQQCWNDEYTTKKKTSYNLGEINKIDTLDFVK